MKITVYIDDHDGKDGLKAQVDIALAFAKALGAEEGPTVSFQKMDMTWTKLRPVTIDLDNLLALKEKIPAWWLKMIMR